MSGQGKKAIHNTYTHAFYSESVTYLDTCVQSCVLIVAYRQGTNIRLTHRRF
uniref:Uncharacterized protein n=1 Tax=Anguilla anguilla TaxID=7936 RepID=A0A0E9XJK9_ANGAN